MMKIKSIYKRTRISLALMTVLLLPACVPGLPADQMPSGSLNLIPQIEGATQTKAVGDEVVGIENENALVTLDVFIKGVGSNNSNFWKSYHLPSNGVNPTADVRNLLSGRWRSDGFVEGDLYSVYVVANHDFGGNVPSNLTELTSAREDEFSEECLWSDGTLDPSKMTLHKTYMDQATYDASTIRNKERIYTPSKRYLMDGFVEQWTPVGGGDQEIEVNLERAASRFEIELLFDPEFLAANPLAVGGQPGWRFINFAFDAPVINPAHLGQDAVDSQRMLSSGALLLGNAEFVTTAGVTSASIVTYSYPRKWNREDAVEMAPAVVISIPYQKGSEVTYNYYRIPIVNQLITSEIERNKIYRVTATISSTGASSLEDLTESIVDYQVIQWNDAAHSGTQPADIVSTERMFLQVTPHTYILRGNGAQSVDLTYYLPSGEHIGIQYFNQAGNEKIAAGNSDQVGNTGMAYTIGRPAAWYYNNKDAYRTTFLNNNVQVAITDNNAQGDVAKGTITVNSTSLANKAIKNIAFRVYLDVDDWYAKGLYRDIYIRHFPTDNIQTITGSWSSRWDGQPYGGSTLVYYRKIFYKSTQTSTEINQQTWASGIGNNNDDRKNADSQEHAINGYFATGGSTATVTIRARDLSGNNQRRGIVSVTGHTWNGRTLTVEGTRNNNNTRWTYTIGSNNNYYDYFVSAQVDNPGESDNSAVITLFKYSHYYRLDSQEEASYSPTGPDGSWTSYDRWEWEQCDLEQYNATPAENRKTENAPAIPNTGTWVDWDTDEGQTLNPRKYTFDGHFDVKKFNVADGRIYSMSVDNNGRYTRATSQNNWYGYSTTGGRVNRTTNIGTFTNNHMYVIQITKTSNDYVMGRPELDANSQSQDHVVSPAFMIASQLGGISVQFNQNAGTAPALHCASYMEVGEDGTRYVGWRLPTREEISVIVEYQGTANSVTIDGVTITNQDDRILLPVLTARYYFTLDGGTVDLSGNTSFYAVRCIRDMSAAEVKALNKD